MIPFCLGPRLDAHRPRFGPGLRRLYRGLLVALATLPHPAVSGERPLVILFGGYGSTEADMRLWAEAARRDPTYGPVFTFEGIPYPKGVGSSPLRAVAAASATIAEVASRLRIRTMERSRTIVAGHSSGAALAVSVVSSLGETTPVKLISLDAGVNANEPHPDTRPIPQIECWSAASATRVSFGFERVRTLCEGHAFVLRTERCATPVCLHFYVINRRVDPTLTFPQSRAATDGISGGYRPFSVNLDWLARSR